ncbi:MAG: hypothetical protein IPJ30_19925 [Acidobacteria bacterium]|nr:hypothetical protein [Acidobacteriota bacterium]
MKVGLIGCVMVVWFQGLFGFACFGGQQDPGEVEYREICSIPESDGGAARSVKFNSYPVDTQIDIYLHSQYAFECGKGSFPGYISRNGEGKVQTIFSRIRSEKRAVDRLGLIVVIEMIDRETKVFSKRADLREELITLQIPSVEGADEVDRSIDRDFESYRKKIIDRSGHP